MEVGGIPQNESEAVEYLQKNMFFFALSEVSFLKVFKTVTEYELITNYFKLVMNETKFIMFLKVIFPW